MIENELELVGCGFFLDFNCREVIFLICFYGCRLGIIVLVSIFTF